MPQARGWLVGGQIFCDGFNTPKRFQASASPLSPPNIANPELNPRALKHANQRGTTVPAAWMFLFRESARTGRHRNRPPAADMWIHLGSIVTLGLQWLGAQRLMVSNSGGRGMVLALPIVNLSLRRRFFFFFFFFHVFIFSSSCTFV